MLREGVTPEQAVGILTDDLYGIGLSIMEKKSDPERFARDEVTRALSKIKAEAAEDLALLRAEPIDSTLLDKLIATDKKKRLDGVARFKAIKFSDLARRG